ncbi:MAG: ATP-dependent Clp protease adaptor ClpS [Bacteroidia bacterium]|nr:ATP-dependent Clp protease adaptor ClpS [Bacteroidia bacterium]
MKRNSTQTEKQTVKQTLLLENEVKDLILWNDDVNTFEFVIETLVDLCKHDPIQAEQCTMLVHYSGKCAVKKGEYYKLLPIQNAFSERGLTSTIE